MARKDFHHPFQPYDIQQQFMQAVYDCLEKGGVGIFESPTGTGKSLSLICGSLTWLREHKRKLFDEAIQSVDNGDGEPEWMAEHAKEQRSREIRQMRADFEARLTKVRERERKIRERNDRSHDPSRKRVKLARTAEEPDNAEDDFLLGDYESDGEDGTSHEKQYSNKTALLMEQLGILTKQDPREDETAVEELKIFFCSRTHSQLSQFVGELQRVRLPPGLPPENPSAPTEQPADPVEELKHLTLGSRKNLCINPTVSRLTSQTAMNERCIELQQSKTPASQKCQFLPSKDSENALLDFRDHALAKIRDIEDLAELGTKLQVCPYYASRPAIRPAEIVTLPYPLLLQESARDALNISLKGHVVILDEAHNLMSAIEGTYSSQITNVQLQQAKATLIVYLQKFRNRLKGSNRVYVTQVVRVIDSLLLFIDQVKDAQHEGNTVAPGALLAGKGVDQINLTKLVKYMHESKLARKVEGYRVHISSQAGHDPIPKSHSRDQDQSKEVQMPTLMHVQNFLLTMMNPSSEGQFLWSRQQQGATSSCDITTIRYLLLDPSAHFRTIVESARAVILAGGTMSPMSDYATHLFPYLPPSSITTFSCGHLIPASSLFVRTITHDDAGQRLELSFRARNEDTASKLGAILCRIADKVKGGLVVFFPSYGFLEMVLKSWRSVNGKSFAPNSVRGSLATESSILSRLQAMKPLFTDQRPGSLSPSNSVSPMADPTDQTTLPVISAEALFKSYSSTIQSNPRKGAMLLSVLGGKLSEGINFSDDLGRCVVVVGLPFPNIHSPELQAKLKYLDASAAAAKTRTVSGTTPAPVPAPSTTSKTYLENSCMRSVNQAIGRAIRHKDDWASIVLCDARFGDERIYEKLPQWIRTGAPPKSSVSHSTPGNVERDLDTWFKGRVEKQA